MHQLIRNIDVKTLFPWKNNTNNLVLFSLAVLQEKLTTLALYIGYIGKSLASLVTEKMIFPIEYRYDCCSIDIDLFNRSILYHNLCYSKTQAIKK